MTEINKQTRAFFTGDDSETTAADIADAIRDVEAVLAMSPRTVATAKLISIGVLRHAPAGIPDTAEIREWLHRTTHSTYMTGRMSATAAILQQTIPELLERLKRYGSGDFTKTFLAAMQDGDAHREAVETLETALTDGPVNRAPLPEQRPVDLTGAKVAVHELPDSAVDLNMSEADAAFTMVSGVINKYPGSRISLEGMPAGVESRLRAAFPNVNFLELDDETREQLDKVIDQHRAERSKLN